MDARLYALATSCVRQLCAIGGHRLFEKRFSGIGSLLTFHHIAENVGNESYATKPLSVGAEYFRAVIEKVIRLGYEIVTMDEAAARLTQRSGTPGKFACLTFDDGYRSNYEHAFPICRELQVPALIYVATGFLDRKKPIWWLGLERIVAENDKIEFPGEGGSISLPAATPAQKRRAYSAMAERLTAAPQRCLAVCEELGRRHGVSFMEITDRAMMTPAMLLEMRASGLIDFGAHTVSHPNLARLDADEAWREIVDSRDRLAALLGESVRHFAYPYGSAGAAGPREFDLCRKAGFATAVTTRTGNLFRQHRGAMMALPRLHIDGRYQDEQQIDALTSGTLAALRQCFRPSPA